MKHALVTAAACILALMLPGTAQADSSPRPRNNSLEAGLYLGLFFPSSDHEFYDPLVTSQEELGSLGFGGGLRLAYFPLAFVGVEGEGDLNRVSSEVDGSVNLFGARAHLILQLPARLAPFVLGGVGTTWSRSGDDVQGDDQDRIWHLGVGAKYFVSDRLALRVDGRLYRGPHVRAGLDDNGMTNHFAATAGVSLVLGGASEPTEVVDPDPDGDGIVGAADECPMVAGVAPSGCPVTDADGDGIVDSTDRCPQEAETANGFEDEDGCPDEIPDGDGDGLDDRTDRCPKDPEDGDGFEDEDGCPDQDNDGDGLLDSADNCPDEVGPAENRGCPDSDRDGDGVVDRLDNCPDEAGTAENQGCKKKQLVVLRDTKIEILDRVYFRSGKARLRRRSNRLLNNVADVLKAHPEILEVSIEGHTDDRGSDELNQRLSQHRAEAVRAYLSRQGVSASRLVAVGFGESRPIESNETRDGRAANRRVEFNIAKMAPPTPVEAPAETAPEAKPETAPEAKPETAPEAKPETAPEAKPE